MLTRKSKTLKQNKLACSAEHENHGHDVNIWKWVTAARIHSNMGFFSYL